MYLKKNKKDKSDVRRVGTHVKTGVRSREGTLDSEVRRRPTPSPPVNKSNHLIPTLNTTNVSESWLGDENRDGRWGEGLRGPRWFNT